MTPRILIALLCLLPCARLATAQDAPAVPPELQAIKEFVGVWDADIEVWPDGLDKPSVKFKGVETNRAYGDYWIASDFDSDFQGSTIRVHSIVGYDLEQKRLVGINIDHGPYAARLLGTYDPEKRTLDWETQAKDEAGNPISQRTRVVLTSPTERMLVLSAPSGEQAEYRKVMQIRFVKRPE